MVEHVYIVDPEIHEPKGVAAAAVDKVYVSDGAGSGSWKTITNKGWENIDHAGAVQNLSNGVRTKVLNDNLGVTSLDYAALPNATDSIWDESVNSFDWAAAGLEVGDTVDIRVDIDYTVNTNNDGVLLELDLGVGSATTPTIILDERNIDQVGTQRVVRFISFFIGNSDILNNPADLYVTANSSGDSIDVSGWYVRMNPINPRYS